jgi:hypothetical protein
VIKFVSDLIQHYVIKFVSDLWQVGGFLPVPFESAEVMITDGKNH